MLPGVLLLDGPESSLHPTAVGLVGEMIAAVAKERQVIVATQSPLLVDEFDLDEIGVFGLGDGRTRVRRFDGEEYKRWLEKYSTGQLWEKNLPRRAAMTRFAIWARARSGRCSSRWRTPNIRIRLESFRRLQAAR